MAEMEEELKELLNTLYDISDAEILYSAARGLAAENHVISGGGSKYFIKKYRLKRTKGRILEVHQAEQFFFEEGIPVIVPLKNKNGETLFECGGRLISVFPYVEGKYFDKAPTQKAVQSGAEALARLHIVGQRGDSLRLTNTLDSWDKEEFLAAADKLITKIQSLAMPSVYDKLALDSLSFKSKLARAATVTLDSLHFQHISILHGDYHYHNLFFNEDDTVSHIFDFERVMRGACAAELAYGLFFFCFDQNTEPLDEVSERNFDSAKLFIAAYRSIMPLEQEEILNGLRWYYWRQMVHALWPEKIHYEENDFRSDGLLPKRLNRFRYFSKDPEVLLARILKT